MQTYDLGQTDTVSKEAIYAATGLSQLRLEHLAAAVRVEMPDGNIAMAGRRWFEYDERAVLAEAIALAKQWLSAWQVQPGLSFVITSGAISSDLIMTQVGNSWEPIGPYLFTGYGNGKTTIAQALFYSCGIFTVHETVAGNELRIYKAGKMLSAREWLMQTTNTESTLAEFLCSDGMTRTQVVVIDDVGREGALPFIRGTEQPKELQARYFDLINHCYQRQISVIITSNFRFDALARYLGGATWSRLMEMVPDGYMVDITGVRDYRPIAGGRVPVRL
jgi:predicted ATPase